MTVVIQIFCYRSFLPDEEFWSLYLRTPPGYHELHDSVRTIMQCAHKNLATSDLLLKSELLCLFYLLASTPGLCTEHTVSTESRMTETLRPVLTYIQKHHSESVTIEQLAKIAHMSSSYFMSCFKQISVSEPLNI